MEKYVLYNKEIGICENICRKKINENFLMLEKKKLSIEMRKIKKRLMAVSQNLKKFKNEDCPYDCAFIN